MVAHTGNAWACSPVFAEVLSVLHSWVRRSLGIANVCCFSQALLYGYSIDANGGLTLDLQLPLYVEAAAPVLFPGEPVAEAHYFSLKKGERAKADRLYSFASTIPKPTPAASPQRNAW